MKSYRLWASVVITIVIVIAFLLSRSRAPEGEDGLEGDGAAPAAEVIQ